MDHFILGSIQKLEDIILHTLFLLFKIFLASTKQYGPLIWLHYLLETMELDLLESTKEPHYRVLPGQYYYHDIFKAGLRIKTFKGDFLKIM